MILFRISVRSIRFLHHVSAPLQIIVLVTGFLVPVAAVYKVACSICSTGREVAVLVTALGNSV